MQDITIILTPVDAELFKKFQEHHEIFHLMQIKGLFDIQFGKGILHFNSGKLKKITKEEDVYLAS